MISKRLYLLIVLFLLCTSIFSAYKIVKLNDKFHEAKIDLKDVREYKLGPNISEVEGTLITRMYYGPPGYGEDPDKDEKEYPFILQLDNPIRVVIEETEDYGSYIIEISEIQVVLNNEEEINIVKLHKDKHIKIEGKLFLSFTGHHHTRVLIEVENIVE
ncbi:DUF4431 domain-containing protein [Vallitalea okinawensis]|uniref:DUF4431 domain-containing protein n=1 Tax=Vallitalea okinawensis TaxID=2078660 RepID=UPI000CFD524F|nr:DUF4431 domain-containing protein [Vallitalea okinawensis]